MTLPRSGRMHATLLVAALSSTPLVPQTSAGSTDLQSTPAGPFARIAILRPHDGDSIDFEAGYIRHLDAHRLAKDTWVWYGWSIWAGDRQRWFVYATFGHTAASLDNPIPPAEDEQDNVTNVTPHAQFVGNAIRGTCRRYWGTGTPTPVARVEFTTVDLNPGTGQPSKRRSRPLAPRSTATLWYRMVVGGPGLRYVRLRPRPNLSAILDGRSAQALPEVVNQMIVARRSRF